MTMERRQELDERIAASEPTAEHATDWRESQEIPSWRADSAERWSGNALDATEEFTAAIAETPEVANNFRQANMDDPDFRPSWLHDPHDGTAEKVVRASERFAQHNIDTDERVKLADNVATMMTKNAWDEVARVEGKEHPDSKRVYEQLVDKMEDACQMIMYGLVRGEPATVIGALISAAEYDHQARQFNRTGTLPAAL